MSAPAKARSVASHASSQPMAIVSLRADSAWGGPMVITFTRPPNLSLRLSPSSTAYSSKGLTTAAIPSRFSVPVSSSNSTSVVSGTCLMQTTMSNPSLI